MQKDSRILDDLSRLGTSALGSLLDLKREIEASVSAQVEKLLAKSHVVRREEFEIVQAMAIKALEENEKFKSRLEELEKQLS